MSVTIKRKQPGDDGDDLRASELFGKGEKTEPADRTSLAGGDSGASGAE